MAPIEGVKPNPANTLSIAVSGSVLSTFYHDYEYYSGRDVYVAEPKEPMTKEEMLYYAYIIEQNKYRYNYGRGANRTFKDILVPTKNEMPSYIKEIKIPSIKNEIINKDKIKLNDDSWKWFNIKDFCQAPYKALAYNALDLTECSEDNKDAIRYITRTDVNNGCKCYVINDNFEKVEKGNAITIGDTTSTIYYQNRPFICGDHMVVLRSEYFNLYTGLFITALLSKERFRYNYGRAFKKDIIYNTRIKLPVTPLGEPDWQFMEDYIKSLPYSKNLEPIDPNEQIRALKKKLALREHQLYAQQSGQIVNFGTINFNDNSKNFRLD